MNTLLSLIPFSTIAFGSEGTVAGYDDDEEEEEEEDAEAMPQ